MHIPDFLDDPRDGIWQPVYSDSAL